MHLCNLLAQLLLEKYPDGIIYDNTVYINVDGNIYHSHERTDKSLTAEQLNSNDIVALVNYKYNDVKV